MASEARLVSASNIQEVAEWCGGVVVQEHDAIDHSITNPALNVGTINGVERVHIGDTLIRNHNGSFQVWKAD